MWCFNTSSLLILIIFIISLPQLYAQGDDCNAASNLGTISYHLNQTADIGAALNFSTSTITNTESNPPVCLGTSINPAATGKDGWYRFTAANTVRMIIQYNSTDASAD